MAIYKVRKRNGAIVDFDKAKIEKAIKLAFESTGVTVFEELKSVTAKVIKVVDKKI